MSPPSELDVIDKHGGFTALIETRSGPNKGCTNTLWRPGRFLKKTTKGKLLHYNEDSFYQMNNDVTEAQYKVPGYPNVVIVWFDNQTEERIA